jgi:cAMP-dependent protein kinase regulator
MEGLDALKISEEKKKYIVEMLNPVLEEMVAECIHKTPADPVPFMLEWLENKKVQEEDKLLSPEDKDRLVQENEQLQQNVNKVKSQMQEAAKLAIADPAPDEDEEEDDADDEPPPGFFERLEAAEGGPPKARQSVSAEAYGEWNAKKAFVPPVNPKTDEQKDRLKTCLTKSFMFSSLENNDLGIIIGAMKEVNASPKDRLIKKGDSGDFLFVVESGKLECIIDGKVVKTCAAGDVFGELALLYNCPRAADVDCSEKGVLWQLDRDTFNHIVKEAAQKKRARYDAFLTKVPLLASMDNYERSQLADALKVEAFEKPGSVIVSQGEEGKKFYIIEDGEAIAMKNGVQVMSYTAGDYFGELALIRNQPRAATVTAKSSCRLLSIDSGSFKRLLNVSDLLERANKYA